MMLRSHVSRFGAELGNEIGNSRRSWSDRQGLIFVIEDQGTRGFGEASPLPGYSPDTIEECEECLRSIQLLGDSPQSLRSIEKQISSMPPLPAARFAVETALLDLLAQRLGRSVGSLFGQYATSARRCALLDPDDALASAALVLERGIKSAKLKVGGEWSEDLTAIRQLRKQYPELELRLDVNAGWSVADAKKRLALLQGLGIAFVEQPVAPGMMAGLAGSKVPIAADESLQSEAGREGLKPLFGDPAMRVFVLKPTVIGGFRECLRLQQLGRGHSITAIASHCFEGPVGTAAVAELALAMDSSMASGVDEHPVLTNLGDVRVPQLGARFLQPHHVGLGVELEV